MEDPEVPNAGGEKVPECTKNKIDEAKSNDDTRKVKNCCECKNFGILDCTVISGDSPEEICGGEKIIGIDSLCSPGCMPMMTRSWRLPPTNG